MWKERAFRVGDVLAVAKKGRYRVDRFLARGGYSEVYEVVHERTSTHYALKALQLKHAPSPKTRERQRREAQTLYRLRHPNVVQVHAVGVREKDGLLYMIMDLLVGRTADAERIGADLAVVILRNAVRPLAQFSE